MSTAAAKNTINGCGAKFGDACAQVLNCFKLIYLEGIWKEAAGQLNGVSMAPW